MEVLLSFAVALSRPLLRSFLQSCGITTLSNETIRFYSVIAAFVLVTLVTRKVASSQLQKQKQAFSNLPKMEP
jgi:hypothetical protein